MNYYMELSPQNFSLYSYLLSLKNPLITYSKYTTNPGQILVILAYFKPTFRMKSLFYLLNILSLWSYVKQISTLTQEVISQPWANDALCHLLYVRLLEKNYNLFLAFNLFKYYQQPSLRYRMITYKLGKATLTLGSGTIVFSSHI